MSAVTREEFDALAERVTALENARPGRKRRLLLVSEKGVCGLDPSRDSSGCPDASLYRRNQGCKGNACMIVSANHYKRRNLDRRKRVE